MHRGKEGGPGHGVDEEKSEEKGGAGALLRDEQVEGQSVLLLVKDLLLSPFPQGEGKDGEQRGEKVCKLRDEKTDQRPSDQTVHHARHSDAWVDVQQTNSYSLMLTWVGGS